jgi:hypothetical protein
MLVLTIKGKINIMETIEIGSTPCEELCTQVGDDDYTRRALIECRAWKNQLYRHLASLGHSKETLPEKFRISIKSMNHDLGVYHEVAVIFNDNDEKSWELALLLESDSPTNWDDEAKKDLTAISE